jgi:protein-disulfide isomerase
VTRHRRRPRRDTTRRPPLSGSKTPQQTTRRERRAAERDDRFLAERNDRRQRTGAPTGGGSSLINTKTMTVAAVVVGVLIVVIVGIGQLGGAATGTFRDPAIAYPAAIRDHTALGPTTAPLTLDVYSDFQCPYCARSVLDVEPALVSRYVTPGNLRIVHHEVQFIGHTESRTAMAGAYCADQQGKYWPYALWVYDNQQGENLGGFAPERLTAIAKAAGVDIATFAPCLSSAATLAAVDAESAAGVPKVNGGTPSFYLNGTFVSSGVKAASDWGAIFDKALGAASASPAAPASASTTP